MGIRKTNLVSGEIYHIYNRGVDKREIFLDDEDRMRFIHDLFEFNDSNPTINLAAYLAKTKEVGLPKIHKQPRLLLVEIIAFCMMGNHFHLLVRQKEEKGITNFMRKLGTGYTNYFNKKYQRNGSLFQGKFKSVHLEKEAHLLYLPIYIHLNPLDFKFPEWRDGHVNSIKEAMHFLESYRWSSYLDYAGKKNFPSLIHKDFLFSLVGGSGKMRQEIICWLKNLKETAIKEIIIED